MTFSCRVIVRKFVFIKFIPLNVNYKAFCSKADIDRCFSILGVEVGSDQETVRQAFLLLVKKFHPDSVCHEASQQKFQEIESAYRKLQIKFANDRHNVNEGAGEYGLYYKEKVEEVEEFDIKHTAPQHRQYLNYDGVGSGTPSQREKQYIAFRAAKAVDNVNMYRINKLQDSSQEGLIKQGTKKRVKDIKTGIGMDRLVEDLIQESMARGEFDNLSGSGKPLRTYTHENPHVDFITHKMNQVLIENGFIPTWILYQKEIRERNCKLTDFLKAERSKLGPYPLTVEESDSWNKIKEVLREDIHILNDKINTYNLLVPILGKQLLHFDLEKESEKILKEGSYKEMNKEPKVESELKKNESIVGSISAFLRSHQVAK